ncbi:hypothetical protein MLD38_021711 [Melastoma candidum]|uniref:Uncharacterized protein n=1 Tax=Melastoma candidum TaxID=119954 RepID=A0ACB9QHG3_9MYRT|nr:hypothetical protein MLD38_021711 [Melastoma candidum]
MGKYLKKSKPKSSAEVSLPSASSSSSSSHLVTTGGVCTRAKTLALQSLRHPPPPQVSDPDPDLSYLQLRSRRLHKTIVSSSKGKERERMAFAEDDLEKGGIDPSDSVATSFGENDPLEFDARDRRARESTPCSFLGGSITIPMPGSMTRRRSSISSQRIRNDVLRGIPTTREIEDFFAAAEEQQRKSFIEKYNFDILTDKPLAGRYEWLEVMP